MRISRESSNCKSCLYFKFTCPVLYTVYIICAPCATPLCAPSYPILKKVKKLKFSTACILGEGTFSATNWCNFQLDSLRSSGGIPNILKFYGLAPRPIYTVYCICFVLRGRHPHSQSSCCILGKNA